MKEEEIILGGKTLGYERWGNHIGVRDKSILQMNYIGSKRQFNVAKWVILRIIVKTMVYEFLCC